MATKVRNITNRPLAEAVGNKIAQPGAVFFCPDEKAELLAALNPPKIEFVTEDEADEGTGDGTKTKTPGAHEEWKLSITPEQYLKQYPTGPHAEQAKKAVEKK